eukprot:3016312-Pleurochrysis_carterae.AAC.1
MLVLSLSVAGAGTKQLRETFLRICDSSSRKQYCSFPASNIAGIRCRAWQRVATPAPTRTSSATKAIVLPQTEINFGSFIAETIPNQLVLEPASEDHSSQRSEFLGSFSSQYSGTEDWACDNWSREGPTQAATSPRRMPLQIKHIGPLLARRTRRQVRAFASVYLQSTGQLRPGCSRGAASADQHPKAES